MVRPANHILQALRAEGTYFDLANLYQQQSVRFRQHR